MTGARIAARGFLALIAASALVAPVAAEVTADRNGGFSSINSVVVSATRWQVWEELIHPEYWWAHSLSGDPNNLALDTRAGGCFCEDLPVEGSWETGSVEHGRVIAVIPEQVLQISGALASRQSAGVDGTLTVTLSDVAGGTKITWEYVVGGAARSNFGQIAPAADNAHAELLRSFVNWLTQ